MHILIIILWKNLVLIKRHYITTLVEIFLPILITFTILFANMKDEHNIVPENTHGFEEDLFTTCQSRLANSTLFFSPNTGFGAEMGLKFKDLINIWKLNGTTLQGATNQKQLEAFFASIDQEKRRNSYGFAFKDTDETPKDFKYTVMAESLYPQVLPFLQLLVDFAYMSVVDSTDVSDLSYVSLGSKSLTYVLEGMPSPEMILPSSVEAASDAIVSLALGTAYTVILTLIAIVILDNKCSGVTELMKIMGMDRWMEWVSWILKVFMVQLVVVAVVVILLTEHILEPGPYLANTDPLLLYIFLLLYVLASMCFMFAITTIFYRALWGTLAVLIVSIVCLITMMSLTITPAWQWAALFLPNGALYYGLYIVKLMEGRGLGVRWSNLNTAPSKGVGVNMLGVIMILILETLLYFLLAYYIEAVRKGPYGMPEPWYYPINKVMQMRKNKVDVDRTESPAPGRRPSNYEPPSKSDQPGISIQNLRKVFPATNTVAVDGVNVDFYKGQITVLLGHNGAGKTTTMDIIAGMGTPTSGTVLVNGLNIRTDLVNVRKSMGLCMQKNIVYNNLTVMENLTLIGLIKGKSWKDIRAEAKEMIKFMNFEDKRKCLPSQLSGGQKRKLCLCVALIAGSEVVILDEPTSGLDPEARRVVWDVLLAMRGQRTVLITTHYMEEADALADKVAIMDHGKVVCYGTSLYLKNKYGGGFKMAIIIQPNSNINKITKLVESFVSGSELKSHMGAQLNYLLPASNKGQFADLFDSLQKKKDELGIISMGVSAATLDEVFLAVGKQASSGNKDIQRSRPLSEQSLRDRVTGLKLMWQQFIALLYKKLLYMAWKWFMIIFMALLPILGCIVALFVNVGNLIDSNEDSPYYSLSSAEASDPQVLYSAQSDAVSTDISRQYKGVAEAQGASLTDLSDQKDFRAAMLKKAYENPWEYRASVIAAGEINVPKGGKGRRVTAFYGSERLYKPIAVLLMNNAILRYRTKSDGYSITMKTHRIQVQQESKLEMPQQDYTDISFYFFYFMLAMFVGIFMWLPHAERVSSGKQIQVMTGAGVIIYWLTIFLLDFLLYMIVLALVLITFVVCDSKKYYSGPAEIGAVTLIILLYGLAQIPVVYLFSLIIASVTKSFFIYTMTHVIILMVLAMMDLFLHGGEGIWVILVKIPVPQLPFIKCFKDFFNIAFWNNQCNLYSEEVLRPVCADARYSHPCCQTQVKTPYIDVRRESLANLLICVAVYWGLFIIIESGVIGLLLSFVPIGSKQTDEDDDVKNERERVGEGEKNGPGQDILVAKDLAKTYGWDWCEGKFAVKGVTFGVLPGECFGLLGTNGAGKTTTFKMLTAGVIPSRGTARINQFGLKRHRGQYMKQIGYCPQEDPILEVLTGRQMLVLFAQLRGIPRDKTHQHVDMWVQRVGLSEYERRPCGTYSGGNKRKLCTALALIGEPPIVFLDEPTAGIDPVARRTVWGILTSIQKSHNCIVLTSHSMEECEALCNRLSIQVKGELKCIGSIPYLKQKFGKGFTVTIKLKDTKGGKSDVDKLKKTVAETFLPCDLKDEHSVLLQYHVTNPDLTWKFLFQNMESLKDRMPCIDDYSVSETSLEEIFLSFAKASKKKKVK